MRPAATSFQSKAVLPNSAIPLRFTLCGDLASDASCRAELRAKRTLLRVSDMTQLLSSTSGSVRGMFPVSAETPVLLSRFVQYTTSATLRCILLWPCSLTFVTTYRGGDFKLSQALSKHCVPPKPKLRLADSKIQP